MYACLNDNFVMSMERALCQHNICGFCGNECQRDEQKKKKMSGRFVLFCVQAVCRMHNKVNCNFSSMLIQDAHPQPSAKRPHNHPIFQSKYRLRPPHLYPLRRPADMRLHVCSTAMVTLFPDAQRI